MHGRDFFRDGGSGIACPGFSVHFFRLEVSKQNEKVCHKLRDVLKRHPCRIGLKWASTPISPWVSAFC